MIYVLLFLQLALAGGGRRSVPESPVVNPACVEPQKKLVVLGENASADFKVGGRYQGYAQEALCWLNRAYDSGCIREKVLAHRFKTLESVLEPRLKVGDNELAYVRYTGGSPHSVDLRWYRKRFTKTIGYTYNYKSDTGGPKVSETRIWTNWNKIGSAKSYASHLGHEISHNARSGGFGHWSRKDGSFPYSIGQIVWDCIQSE